MKAVTLTLKAFLPHIKGKHLLIRTDNTSVLNYINHQGGVKSPSLCMHTWVLLQWCIDNKITLKAIHIAGVDNILADTLSRTVARHSEWSIQKRVAYQIFHHLGTPNIDLFATQENKQVPIFCSWKSDPLAYQQDGLSLQWGRGLLYAYPPLGLLPVVIQKVAQEEATMILIAPWWPRRSWFPGLLALLRDVPRLLPLDNPLLLSQKKGRLIHPQPEIFHLVAWPVSGKASLIQAFHQKLLQQSCLHTPSQPSLHTKTAGHIFLSGVGQEVVIPLLPL
jgi:hypothetical protein